MIPNRQSVIDFAVKTYNKYKDKCYSVEDAMVYSLEEHDTPDMTHEEYSQLFKEIHEKCL